MKQQQARVLVADFDGKKRREVIRHLEDTGYEVIPAASGADLLIQCEVDPPDVIVVDVNLPDMEGYDVCGELRHLPDVGDTPIIVTAQARDELTQNYLAQMVEYAGGDYFLAKPYDIQVLIKLLVSLLPEVHPSRPHGHPAFPTRVTWPTLRLAPAAL